MPGIVSQLNVFRDKDGLLRVKSKFIRWNGTKENFPILLAKNSKLVQKLIFELHQRLHHSGCYSILSELSKNYYIPHRFSTVKKILKNNVGDLTIDQLN